MAKRQAETQTANTAADAAIETDALAAEVSPADAHDSNLDNHPARGGSYVIEGGVRRLVERTEADS